MDGESNGGVTLTNRIKYYSCANRAALWGVSERQVRKIAHKIPGAFKLDPGSPKSQWCIPEKYEYVRKRKSVSRPKRKRQDLSEDVLVSWG